MAEVLAEDWKLGVGGSYDTIAGQRDGALVLNHTPVDVTNKDSSQNRELIAGIFSWGLRVSGCLEETDTGFGALWTAWNGKAAMAARWTTPAANTYTGSTHLTSVEYSGPYNDVFVFSAAADGTSTLTKA